MQDVATEVANNKKSVTFAPGTHDISVMHIQEGVAPAHGVCDKDGDIFIGSCPLDQWRSEGMQKHH